MSEPSRLSKHVASTVGKLTLEPWSGWTPRATVQSLHGSLPQGEGLFEKSSPWKKGVFAQKERVRTDRALLYI